jgi:hypothetical protein
MTIGEYLMRLSKSGAETNPRLLTVLCQHVDSSSAIKKGTHRCAPFFYLFETIPLFICLRLFLVLLAAALLERRAENVAERGA